MKLDNYKGECMLKTKSLRDTNTKDNVLFRGGEM